MKSLDPGAASGRDVLLLAPHPDDEALGCGGTLALMARAGARVSVVVCARGDGGIAADASAGDELVAERRRESEAACAALGVSRVLFLGRSSAELRADPEAVAQALGELAGRRTYDVLLLPWPLERHDTHRAVTLAGLLADLVRADGRVLGFGVWDALPADDDVFEVDVTEARTQKARAIGAHKSQDGTRPLTAGMAARDLSQAVFSRITGDETRKAVERLLDLGVLHDLVRGTRVAGSDASAARASVAMWQAGRAVSSAGALWGDGSPADAQV
ncbi:MAG: PIG-L family deacetylase [Planctomycetes bacterium]|nr:PIG-L family deacetylase [Planctomycetota bacterium]